MGQPSPFCSPLFGVVQVPPLPREVRVSSVESGSGALTAEGVDRGRSAEADSRSAVSTRSLQTEGAALLTAERSRKTGPSSPFPAPPASQELLAPASLPTFPISSCAFEERVKTKKRNDNENESFSTVYYSK